MLSFAAVVELDRDRGVENDERLVVGSGVACPDGVGRAVEDEVDVPDVERDLRVAGESDERAAPIGVAGEIYRPDAAHGLQGLSLKLSCRQSTGPTYRTGGYGGLRTGDDRRDQHRLRPAWADRLGPDQAGASPANERRSR